MGRLKATENKNNVSLKDNIHCTGKNINSEGERTTTVLEVGARKESSGGEIDLTKIILSFCMVCYLLQDID